MKVSRRAALKALAAAPIASRLKAEEISRLKAEEISRLRAEGISRLKAEEISRLKAGATYGLDAVTLLAIGEVVLPSEADRKAAVSAFSSWIDRYKEGADTDHGYGNTRVRATGPSPAKNYPAQIAGLDTSARGSGAAGFAVASLEQRRAIVEAAIADAKIERLPTRPNGGHIATDLMGHYFNSSDANDLCYRAAINRDACRGLAGSDLPPKGGSSDLPPKGGSSRQIK